MMQPGAAVADSSSLDNMEGGESKLREEVDPAGGRVLLLDGRRPAGASSLDPPPPSSVDHKKVRLEFNIESLTVAEVYSAEGEDQSVLNRARALLLPWTSKPRARKEVLKDISGVVNSGQLVAIMGATGSGKTSLLSCLSLRNRRFHGTVRTGGAKMAYVQQEDLFIPTLTVEEHLVFHAMLRVGRHVPLPERAAQVHALLSEFGLVKTRNTLIGGGGTMIRGISGGERKRLTLATELLANPSLLFADEPTSGLDSFTAEVVIDKLAQIASGGRAVMCTIHSPPSKVFAMFSHLLLLAEGRLVYFGRRDDALAYFSAAGYSCPSHYNPADYFVEVVGRVHTDVEASNRRVADLITKYDRSALHAGNAAAAAAAVEETDASAAGRGAPALRRLLSKQRSTGSTASAGSDSVPAPAGQAKGVLPGEQKVVYEASWSRQFRQLFHRAELMYTREPILFQARLGQSVGQAVILGLIYLQLGDTQNYVQTKMGALFFIIFNQCLISVFSVALTFSKEARVFLREHVAGCYRTDAYYLSRTLVELPHQCLFPIVFGAISYWMIGLRPDASAFFLFLLTLVLAANTAASLGYAVSLLAMDTMVALAICPVLLFPLFIVGGYFMNLDTVPVYFGWLQAISVFKYGFANLSIVEWQDVTSIPCSAGEDCLFPDGDAVLDYYALSGGMGAYWLNIVWLLVLLLTFRGVAFGLLLWRAYTIKDA